MLEVKKLLIGTILMGILFGGIFWIGIWDWINKKRCRNAIKGTCVKKKTVYHYQNKASHMKIMFAYTYEGKKYQQYALDEFEFTKKGAKFQEGEIYTLYINPKKPDFIRCNKHKLTANTFSCMFGGGFMLFLSILGMAYCLIKII